MSAQRLSAWYDQLGQCTAAGMGLAESLRQSAGPSERDRGVMANRLERGETVDAVLESAPAWLPQADRFLLSAAARSGRLPMTCTQLSTHYRTLADQRRHLLATSAYPIAVLHFTVLSLPFPAAVSFSESGGYSFDGASYGRFLIMALGLFWGGLWGLREFLRRSPRATRRIQRCIPGIRQYAKAHGLARFAWSLEALLGAGVSMRDSFGGAALICDDPVLTPRLLAILPEIECGRPPGPALARIREVPAEFAALYQSGERTGQLDSALLRLSERYEASARASLNSAVFWYPKLLFLLIAILIGVGVIQAFAQYLDFIESLSI